MRCLAWPRAAPDPRPGESLGVEVAPEVRDAIVAPARGVRTIPETLCERVLAGDLGGLTAEEREQIAVGLLLGRNKVTHIHELVKAFGTSRQVEYVRTAKRWQRREPIARKHAYEAAVDLSTGRLAVGVAHAPLVYAEDPRVDLPETLERRVAEVIDGVDPLIVRGWLSAADR